MQAGRILQQRLALASYKALNGWQDAKLEQLEPHAEQKAQERDRKRKAQEAIDQSQQAKKIALASQTQNDRSVHARQDTGPGLPPQMSLYDAMMTPSLGSGMFDSYSPRVADGFAEYPSSGQQHSLLASSDLAPSAHIGQASPGRSGLIIQTALANSTAALHHPASPISSARDTPGLRPGSPLGKIESPHRRTNSTPHQTLSTRDPGFVGTVNAATVLSGLTAGGLEDTIPGPSRITPPPSAKKGLSQGSPKSGSNGRPRARTNPGGEQDAAELMLYLAQSPSPGPVKRKVSHPFPMDEKNGAMKGRQLFAAQDGPEEAKRALAGQPSIQLSHSQSPSHQPPFQPQQMHYSHLPQLNTQQHQHMPWQGQHQQSHSHALHYGMQSAPLLHANSPYHNDLPARSATPPTYRPHSPFDFGAYLNVSPGRSTAQPSYAQAMPSTSYGQNSMW